MPIFLILSSKSHFAFTDLLPERLLIKTVFLIPLGIVMLGPEIATSLLGLVFSEN